jgi:hypothetical protein
MNILFILIDNKLDAHYIVSEDVNNKEKPNQ